MTDQQTRAARALEYGDGPWLDEPDHVDFEHAGYPCILHRNDLGAWCGYVGVPEGHPWFGKGYHDVEADAHGGLTYAEACQGPICHPGDEPRWWLGFDCAHAFDVSPGIEQALMRCREELGETSKWITETSRKWFDRTVTYKDVAYARAEAERLARQAQAAALTREPDEEQAP